MNSMKNADRRAPNINNIKNYGFDTFTPERKQKNTEDLGNPNDIE